MEILTSCELLKIEDILPFFPDFTYINDFKEEICHALEDYNRRIEQLEREMNDAKKSADLIRLDIANLRNRCAFVDEEQKCDHCNYPLLSRPFYMFPCQHGFHSDCLRTEVVKHLDTAHRMQVVELETKIAQLEEKYKRVNIDVASMGQGDSGMEQLRV